jgi:hypothetical protein
MISALLLRNSLFRSLISLPPFVIAKTVDSGGITGCFSGAAETELSTKGAK